jgi:methionyl-tRNA formyltransferase
MRLRVVFAGTPAFAVPALEALLAAEDVVGVLTQPDRPAGRGRVLTPGPVKQRALAAGLPVAQPVSLRTGGEGAAAAMAQLEAWRPDVMVVVAYGLILPPPVLALPRLGCVNIHGSWLPRWRGAAPIQRAILAGEAETGITIMQMDAGLDTGPMLLEGRVPIGPETTSAELHDTLAALGGRLVVDALAGLAAGALQARPQPADGVTYAAKLSRAESLVDWTLPAPEVDRRIRAFNPWPAAESRWRGEPVKLLRSRCVATAGPHAEPGRVTAVDDGMIEVACGEGRVGLLQLQRAGRRAVGAADFANAEPVAAADARFG